MILVVLWLNVSHSLTFLLIEKEELFFVAIFFICDSFKNSRDLIGSDIPNSMLSK